MVEEKIGPSNLYGDVINLLLQSTYVQAISEQRVNPMSNPRIEIKEFDLEKDFVYTAEIAVQPEVKVGEIKKDLQKRLEERKTF